MGDVKLADVQKLRKMTGAGMMDCKNALTEASGDFDRAVELIRERGKAIANKRADREASEGVVLADCSPDGKLAGILTLNCETDFVASNADFVAFARRILTEALRAGVRELEGVLTMVLDGKPVRELVLEQSGVVGEKMALSHYRVIEAPCVSAYIHPGNRMASVVGVSNPDADPDLTRSLAVQVAGMNPVAVDVESVPEEMRNKEFEIGREQARNEGKPEQILNKIAEGRLQKFYKENVLMAQDCFVTDESLTVEQYISKRDKTLRVLCFARFSLAD